MSEYQYYEFQAVDRPLQPADQQALRALSTRARITATSFTNTYEWGDFRGDPIELMERWFDLHLYLANWGTRRLMIRLPKRLMDQQRLEKLLCDVDCAQLLDSGDNLILDIGRDLEDLVDWDDGSSWLAALAGLRSDLLQGDLRIFYLLWLMMVQEEVFDSEVPEPMPGLGPMNASLEAFVDFFGLDSDMVEAAAERLVAVDANRASPDAVRDALEAMTEREKNTMLMRLYDGDPHVMAELRVAIRSRLSRGADSSPGAARTAGELLARAGAIRVERERAEAEQAAAERQRQAEQAEKARRKRLDAIAQRGDQTWSEIEVEIERRNAVGYDRATSLLNDLQAIARERGRIADFIDRLRMIRERHAQKRGLMERLRKMV